MFGLSRTPSPRPTIQFAASTEDGISGTSGAVVRLVRLVRSPKKPWKNWRMTKAPHLQHAQLGLACWDLGVLSNPDQSSSSTLQGDSRHLWKSYKPGIRASYFDWPLVSWSDVVQLFGTHVTTDQRPKPGHGPSQDSRFGPKVSIDRYCSSLEVIRAVH